MSKVIEVTERVRAIIAERFPRIPVTRNYFGFAGVGDPETEYGRINVAPIFTDFDEATANREELDQQVILTVGYRKQFGDTPTLQEIDACVVVVEQLGRLFTSTCVHQLEGGRALVLMRFIDARHDETYSLYDPEVLIAENRFVGLLQLTTQVRIPRETTLDRG